MGPLIVVAGPPKSGKTWKAQQLIKEKGLDLGRPLVVVDPLGCDNAEAIQHLVEMRRMGYAVVVVTSLRKTPWPMPMLDCIQGSSSLTYAADEVWFTEGGEEGRRVWTKLKDREGYYLQPTTATEARLRSEEQIAEGLTIMAALERAGVVRRIPGHAFQFTLADPL